MFITAYYFRAHLYTLVPRHVREDLQWMADHGTDALALSLLEQDLFAAVENVQFICDEARKLGLEVFAVPSRWGGLVAGSPKVPSIFCARQPDSAACNADGSPLIDWLGTKASVHHPATLEFFQQAFEKMFMHFPISGVIWDEVKNLNEKDFSEAARKALVGQDLLDINTHVRATTGFFDRLGREIRRLKPDTRLAMFLYGHLTGPAVEACAAIEHLDDFGCDGSPLRAKDAGDHHLRKFLCDQGPFFVELARRHQKRPLLLIENHAMPHDLMPAMDRRMPEVMNLGAEHLMYYYYPRSLQDPDTNMAIVGRHLAAMK